MTIHTTRKLTLLGFSAVAAIIAATPALAQTTDNGELESVVVTARKRSEDLKDIPSSVSSISAESLQAATAGGADITSLSARTPSLVVETSFGRTFPRFYIRGLGNTDFDLNASQPVSIVFDEVVLENPILKGFPVFDVAAVEVLRGPQGTLFGRNTPAGVVKFDSVKPTEEFGGYARVGVRSFKGFDGEAVINGRLAEGLSGRASFLTQTQGDWVENAAPGGGEKLGDYRELAGRLQLRYQPNEQLDAVLNLHGRKLQGTSQLFRANVVGANGGLVDGFDRDKIFYDGGDGNPQELETWGLSGRVDYDMGAVTLTSVTGYERGQVYSRGDIDGGYGAVFAPPSGPGFIPFPSESADGVDDLQQFTQELRLSSNDDAPLFWQAGAYYFHEDADIASYSYNTLGGGGLDGYAFQNQKTKAWALFGSASYDLTDQLTLTGGLRYSDDDKDYVTLRTLSPVGGGALAPIRVSVGDSSFSWDASLVYEATPDTNLYARVARGYRAPSIQGRVVFSNVVTTADSEFVTSYEAGVKSSLLDRRMRTELSAFYYEIEDQQLTAIGGAGNFNQLVNADKGVGYGFEASVEFRPIPQLTLGASASYNHTEIKDADLTVGVCGAACTVTDPLASPGFARIDGNSFPNAPKWIADLNARYAHPLPNGGELFVYTDWAYKGDTHFFLYEAREFREEGFWEGGVRAGYVSPTGDYEFVVYGRNITDEERLTGAIDFNNLTGIVNGPRIWGAEIKVKY
ncbi:TonB-dependent receptor [Caulobacter sp. NIBR2454]|uniref:TonB-dependent receptor n=1 Tax=Caulobacter sp. NIBR2454 TaxID=3015996 RepID=UPI0022B7380F|nr:TonB-dependent receptor [Caulobacter sp. NIBR2454]